MGMSEAALIGLACVLSKGQSPELEKLSARFDAKERAAISRVIESDFCESKEFQKFLILDNLKDPQALEKKERDFGPGAVATQCIGCGE